MKVETASVLVIGNEILSGRTQDTNTNTIAKSLTEKGIKLVEARVIADDIDTIIRHIRELERVSDIIFTTGGIGPTHDDKTAEAMARAHNASLELNQQAYDTLVTHYGSEDAINEGRRKMAMIPVGATLIDNPVSAAPGFHIGQCYVMAGVPKIMAAMLDNILPTISGGDIVHSQTIQCDTAESILAPILATLQGDYSNTDIGSYPQYVEGGFRVSVVIRDQDESRLKECADHCLEMLDKAGISHKF